MAQKSAEAKTEAAKQEADAIISEASQCAHSVRGYERGIYRRKPLFCRPEAGIQRRYGGSLSKFSSILNSIEDKPEES